MSTFFRAGESVISRTNSSIPFKSKQLPFISNYSKDIRVSLRFSFYMIMWVCFGVKALPERMTWSSIFTFERNLARFLALRYPMSTSLHHSLFSRCSFLNLLVRTLFSRIFDRMYSPCTALPRPDSEKDFKNRPTTIILESSFAILLKPDSLNDSSNFIVRSSKRWNLFAKLPK